MIHPFKRQLFSLLPLVLISACAIPSSLGQPTTNEALRALLLKAKAICFSSQPTAAIPIYKQVLSRDPKNSEAHAGLGWICYLTGKSATAITYEKRAIALDPGNAEPHYYLAAIYMSQKQYQTSKNEQIIAANLAKLRPCNCTHLNSLVNESNSNPNTTGQ